ncbi:spore coat protein CotJB [Candidatus Formimonas warabiya]|uniref:Spore coat protein CotJB n=1 Tax=Formimonas warabiya TaxID=1761012 RepID=A0A3G1KLW5_FORW1|nr:spore coat protein CotJB [Candidatus Formimonas warabiya]ATW23413.1 spore coat protein CotJB [Candidatus Formimonas warabiya]
MSKSNRRSLLRKIQELEFAAVELNLFLDTHPENEQALCDYNRFTEELMNVKNMYEIRYGPLANFGSSPSQFPWQWIQSPWPWEED